jgi:hypothetical protein
LFLAAMKNLEVSFFEACDRVALRVTHDDAHDRQVRGYLQPGLICRGEREAGDSAGFAPAASGTESQKPRAAR